MHIAKSKDPSLCWAYRCKNKRLGNSTLCSKHRHRRKKELNPLAYHYDALKQNAKRRGVPFFLTLPEFETFCESTRYLERKGKNKKSASIDRVDPDKGYSIDNIQSLSLSDNSKKRWTDCPF